MAQDILLSPEEVAERLGVSRLTAIRWMRSGKLKAQKFGRKTVRMKASDLDAFINQQRPALTLVDTTPLTDESAHVPEPLDADTIALAMKLRHPGESLSGVVHRALEYLQQAQDAQGPSPIAGDSLSYDERRAAILARMRALQAEGLPHQVIAKQLNAEGVLTLSGRGQWQPGTVGKMLAQG